MPKVPTRKQQDWILIGTGLILLQRNSRREQLAQKAPLFSGETSPSGGTGSKLLSNEGAGTERRGLSVCLG